MNIMVHPIMRSLGRAIFLWCFLISTVSCAFRDSLPESQPAVTDSAREPQPSPVSATGHLTTPTVPTPTSTISFTSTSTFTRTSMPPIATPIPDSRFLALVSKQDGQTAIQIADVVGAGLTLLASDNKDAFSPQWSPDGLRLAYLSGPNRLGPLEIVVLSSDGKQAAHPVKFNQLWSFDWSPDSSQIAISGVKEPNGRWDVHIVDIEAEVVSNLLPDYEYELFDLAWSLDGAHIAVATSLEKKTGSPDDIFITRHILLLNLKAASKVILDRGLPVVGQLHWSAPGDYLLANADPLIGGGPYRVPTDGSSSQPIDVGGTSGQNVPITNSALSPDGRFILYVIPKTSSTSGDELYIASTDGKAPKLLSPDGIRVLFPAWSPDSQQVAFMAVAAGAEAATSGELFVVKVDGSQLRSVASDMALTTVSWRP